MNRPTPLPLERASRPHPHPTTLRHQPEPMCAPYVSYEPRARAKRLYRAVRCAVLAALVPLLAQPVWAADPPVVKPAAKTATSTAANASASAAAPKPSASSLLKLDDGRAGRGNLIATTGIRGFAKPATPTAHALIMTIGDYQEGIPKLRGVVFDTATATAIATRMGVPEGNITSLKDGDLTLEGMRKALDDLEAKLGGNDQVFIYYSGHGGRQLVQEEGTERCAESLISVDGRGLLDTEVEARLRRLSEKAQKTIVFLDACHSGGVTTRAVAANAPYTAKAYTPPGQSCTRPSNMITRSVMNNKTPGSGGANFVHIAAARDSEVSLDQPNRGGVASQAWLACLAGEARDTDGSGGLSAQEIRACAQSRIEKQLANVQGFLPHHVVINGNPDMVLSYAAKDALPASSAAKPVAQSAKPSPLAALIDIYNSRDDRRLVTMTTTKPALKIGRDEIDFSVTSREGGYLYLLMVGSDGQTFDLLFPNQLDRQNIIEPGATVRLPRPSWALSAEGPPGKNTLLAIVTDNPRDFADAGLQPSGPFSAVQAVAAKDIQLVTAGASLAQDAECSGPAATRTLAVKKRCSNSYGAALLTIEEVR